MGFTNQLLKLGSTLQDDVKNERFPGPTREKALWKALPGVPGVPGVPGLWPRGLRVATADGGAS